MASNQRIHALLHSVNHPPRSVDFPKGETGQILPPSAIFGKNVFNLDTLGKTLPKPIYKKFNEQRTGLGNGLDKSTADAIAHAVRVWAQENGATHFTHIFQPLIGGAGTAEKQDSFLTVNTTFGPGGQDTHHMDTFSGSQLLQSEPDASSFPSGGMRTTFEARGYTIWDTTSPMYIQEGPHGTKVLYIPCIFISYNGEALDEKTILLRSNQALAKAATKLLQLIHDPSSKDEDGNLIQKANNVFVTLGTEQEYFLVDRSLYALRPDLKIAGRALFGKLPPKHQQMEDHYFGKIPSRVLATMSEAELELQQLGVPVKTRHNEVAPAQYEMAPTFEESSIAVDHNLLSMDVIHRVAHRHKLKALFHEKPFKGVNGSGKHCNWSLSTDTGVNLLEPGNKPEKNPQFLLFLVATLQAVYDYSGLLRASIASSSNEHRLGAQEAPPGIISVFLGEKLTEVLNSIEDGRPLKERKWEMTTIQVGGTVLDVKINPLPKIARDLTDRNRTSPFAYVGQKFEFRAVGSKQNPGFPVALLNAAVADTLQRVIADVEKLKGNKPFPSQDELFSIIKKYIISSKKIRFEGDNYSDAWKAEAAKRGLRNIPKSPEAFDMLLENQNKEMLLKTGIFHPAELESRYNVLNEKYVKDLVVEGTTMINMAQTQFIPAAIAYRRNLADTVTALKSAGADFKPELSILNMTSPLIAKAQAAVLKLEDELEVIEHLETSDEGQAHPEIVAKKSLAILVPVMDDLRAAIDSLEGIVEDSMWPVPKYSELLL